MTLFVIVKPDAASYVGAGDKPVAVRSDFVHAKRTAEANIEPPGDNWKLVDTTVKPYEDADTHYWEIISRWRSTILPAMELKTVYGPTIWPIEDVG